VTQTAGIIVKLWTVIYIMNIKA